MDSSILLETIVPASSSEPRKVYLREYSKLPSPWIAHSDFIPQHMVEHLMRRKKDSALGVKFVDNNDPPDCITNMEGALHTFINPMVKATIHGDYQWKGSHSIFRFGSHGDHQLGRRVLISALVQQDFEDERVMLRVCEVEAEAVIGRTELPKLISVKDKQNRAIRRKYDEEIRKYLVYRLTASHRLPPLDIARGKSLTIKDTLDHLQRAIMNDRNLKIQDVIEGYFVRFGRYVISLEIMFMTAVYQVKNEFYLLEQICPDAGYVYTFNPPAIFARIFGSQGTHFLSLVHVAAMKYVASVKKLQRCKCIAWSDYASPEIVKLLHHALAIQPHIKVKRNDDLFVGEKPHLEKQGKGLYVAPRGTEGSVLVIHNNSDAFGQNIESEMAGGSLDGVMGAYSSAAGSLLRQKNDLCHCLIRIP
jgi:hypothetical protein